MGIEHNFPRLIEAVGAAHLPRQLKAIRAAFGQEVQPVRKDMTMFVAFREEFIGPFRADFAIAGNAGFYHATTRKDRRVVEFAVLCFR